MVSKIIQNMHENVDVHVVTRTCECVLRIFVFVLIVFVSKVEQTLSLASILEFLGRVLSLKF